MDNFTIYPAIDLRSGRVVRLQQGDRRRETEYDTDPGAVAKRWIENGATWLHVVNLDGAFGEKPRTNLAALKLILHEANGRVRVQFGGGLRDLAIMAHVLRMGVARVVIGTAAVRNPEMMHSALRTFVPDRIVLGVDYRDGQVQVAGWAEGSEQIPKDLIRSFEHDGLNTVIVTNIRQDGMGTGVDVSGAQALADSTGCEVIASGGVGCLEDIRAVREAGLSGVVVGKALYDGQFTLKEALTC